MSSGYIERWTRESCTLVVFLWVKSVKTTIISIHLIVSHKFWVGCSVFLNESRPPDNHVRICDLWFWSACFVNCTAKVSEQWGSTQKLLQPRKSLFSGRKVKWEPIPPLHYWIVCFFYNGLNFVLRGGDELVKGMVFKNMQGYTININIQGQWPWLSIISSFMVNEVVNIYTCGLIYWGFCSFWGGCSESEITDQYCLDNLWP